MALLSGRNSETVQVALAVALLAWASPASAAPLQLKEGGSALISPLFAAWGRDYAASHPQVTVTIAGSGSRQGTADAFSGAVQIGASDTFLSDEEVRAHPGFVDIALAMSAVEIVYNVPELPMPLKLDGPTLAAIYKGRVRSWDDKAIAELNPDVLLPHHDIVPLRRAADAGETVVLSSYLAITPSEDDYATLEAPNGAGDGQVGLRSGAVLSSSGRVREAASDDGMVEALATTPYSLGYLALPAAAKTAAAKLGVAAVRNHADEFQLPDLRTINAAAAALTLRTPADERLSLVDAPGTGCYPLINYEYAVVAKTQRSEAEAEAIRDFLVWVIGRDVANFERIEAAHFVALRSSTWLRSLSQIDLIR